LPGPEKFRFRKHASIGAAAAEEDVTFLAECYVDNGDLELLADCQDRRRIVLGRTGSGKTALLTRLTEITNAIVINPETLSFNYLTNSTVLQFFLEAGVKLNLFFKLLWRGPLMTELHQWLEAQLAEHKTEPNSGLGKAISYLLNHWPKLTLFLQQPGAPLDNNIAERTLKKAILNRKNALFYKTVNGAGVGDLFMSLIHTCELNGANPFDYLTELQRHAAALKSNPAEWMPWNYRETRARLATPAAA